MRSKSRFALACLGLGSFIPSALGSLGGDRLSIESDRLRLRSRLSDVTVTEVEGVEAHSRYWVRELQVQDDVIREYLNLDGIVFAVSWRGPTQPNLSVLLGEYYSQVVAAESGSLPHGRGRARVFRAQNSVLERSGHMRDGRGMAYVPVLLPQEFNFTELK